MFKHNIYIYQNVPITFTTRGLVCVYLLSLKILKHFFIKMFKKRSVLNSFWSIWLIFTYV